MKIIVIDNYDSFVYNLVRYVEESTSGEVTVFRNDRVDYSVLDSADGILLSPGPGLPSEAGDLMNIIENYHTTTPLLGVCLGHQAIAHFFGCKLIQPQKAYHGKSSSIEHSFTSLLFDGIPEQFEVGRYHSWTVSSETSDCISVTATTCSDNEVMALQHSVLPIQGVQFHPESILTPHGRAIIDNWLKSLAS